MIFFCQFCLICVVRSHGRPSSRGYAPCTFSCSTMADKRNMWPPIVTSRSWINPVGQTELVSAMRNQKGHGSHSWMPRLSHVRRLMTFTPNPPSMIVLAISLPFTITVIVGAGAGFGLMTVACRSAVNRCRVATRVRGEGRDHGGLGTRRDGDKTPTLFGPTVLGAAEPEDLRREP